MTKHECDVHNIIKLNLHIKAQFESPKHLQQTAFITFKCLQQTMLWNCLLMWKCKKCALEKSSPKFCSFLRLFFPKKVALMVNFCPIWSPWIYTPIGTMSAFYAISTLFREVAFASHPLNKWNSWVLSATYIILKSNYHVFEQI